jgi:hypothetical protein
MSESIRRNRGLAKDLFAATACRSRNVQLRQWLGGGSDENRGLLRVDGCGAGFSRRLGARGVRVESSSRGARGCRKTPVLSDGLWRRGDPGVAERPAFPWIASLTLAMTTAVRPKCKLLGSKPNQPDRFRRILFSNGSRRKLLPDVDAFGCLRSLRARSALDGVSWVQGG